MTAVNILSMSVMFAHRRPLHGDRELKSHSVRAYQGLNCSLANDIYVVDGCRFASRTV